MLNVRVMVVEDNALVCAHIERLLSQMDYQVVATAAAAEDAVKKAADTCPDVILMDIHLHGDLDGIWAADQIQNQNDIPVIYMAAYAEDPLLQKAKSTGPYGYLVKPVRDKELLANIEMALYKHQAERRVKHLVQVLRAVREVNQLITREQDPKRLLDQACNVLMGTRGYGLVWIGQQVHESSTTIAPVAHAGQAGFLEAVRITWDNKQPHGGLVSRALSSGQAVVCNDLVNDCTIPWRETALRCGFSSAAAIPMTHNGRRFGVISVYTAQPNAFDDEEISLLLELAGDLAFALKGIEEEAAREKAEIALFRSEESYRRIAETATEGIWMLDANLVTTFANARIAEIIGCPQQEIIGRKLDEFIFPDDLDNFFQRISDRKGGVSERYERRMLRQDGSAVWVIVSASPVLDEQNQFQGIFGMLTDITQRVQVEEQLRSRLVDLEVVYENGLALGQLLEPKEICQKVVELLSEKLSLHHAVVRLLNPEDNTIEVMAFHHENILQEERAVIFEQLQSAVTRPGQGLSGWVIQHGENVTIGDVSRDERYAPSFPSIQSGLYVAIKAGSTTIGCITVESDQPDAFDTYDERLMITVAAQAGIAIENARLYQAAQEELRERKRVEEALRVLNEQLERRVNERVEELSMLNASLERASRLKDEFLASMSHELRTPLTGVLNLSEALQEQVYGSLNEKQLHLLNTIEMSGRHLLGLINDILDLSKIEAGLLDLQMEPCSAGEICQASLQMIKGMAHKKRQVVSFTINPAVIEIVADARRIKQTLVNLLSNAVKFTPEGGRIRLHVETDEEEKIVRFTVSDTGIGIAAQDMPRLFKPFTQLDSRLSRSQTGTGLGLALVKRMADLHGGSISVNSVPGEGSHFTITLPWSSQPAARTGGAKRVTGPLANFAQDVIPNLERLARSLENQKVTCLLYDKIDGADAVAAQFCPDLILMDGTLFDAQGCDFIKRCKAMPEHQKTSFVSVSPAVPDDQSVPVAVDGHISKPLTVTAVNDLLARLAAEKEAPVERLLVIGPVCSGPMILLADDNDINLQTYSDYLRIKGFQVVTANSGPQALQLFQTVQPDLTLMDIQMPGMDGFKVMQSIRTLENPAKRKPIIALTALAMAGDRERCLSAGADEYLSKPISLHELVCTIQTLIQEDRISR